LLQKSKHSLENYGVSARTGGRGLRQHGHLLTSRAGQSFCNLMRTSFMERLLVVLEKLAAGIIPCQLSNNEK